jgi:SAM-dependent methyltransferase
MTKDAVPVNDLIFKELIKRGYSLAGNTRVWDLGDSKLWYLKSDQAQSYLDLLETNEYRIRFTNKEDELIEKKIDEIIGLVNGDSVNLVDLGCGDGKRAINFIKRISEKSKVRYCPVDISSYMVSKAVKNINSIANVREVVEFQWNISDFDNTENILNILKNDEYKRNIILFLGGTLSNSEFHDLIYQIHSGMKSNDLLVIGNFLSPPKEEEMRLLSSPVQKEFADWLIKVPLQLGIDSKDITVNRRIRNGRSEIYFTLKENYMIKFGGREVRFIKGDQIIVLVGYLYPKKTFKEFLDLYFGLVELETYPDETYALALCKK